MTNGKILRHTLDRLASGAALPTSAAYLAARRLTNLMAPGQWLVSWPCAAALMLVTACSNPEAPTPEPTADYWRSVAAGADHTCALTDSGEAFCWGWHSAGQADGLIPEPVAGDLRFRQISAGEELTYAVSMGGEAYSWGSSRVPVEVAEGFTFEQISTMVAVGRTNPHVCGVTSGGAAVCWGNNARGQLGDNSTISRGTPAAVAGGLEFAAVSTGSAHSCGITTAGHAYCWGDGNGSGSAKDSVPTPVRGDSTYSALSSMFEHSCALTPGGAGYCWGAGPFGKLGNGEDYGSFSPEPVSGGLVFSTIDVGVQHTCGVTTDGQGFCWGRNASGQLGTGDNTDADVPVAVAGSLTFVVISAGMEHSCGITADGAMYCWGSGARGALGNGAVSGSVSPVRVRDPA